MLEENNIPTPNHIMMDRGDEINNDNMKEDPNDVEEIEKMIAKYKEYEKELKEENKRKNIKRDSILEFRDFASRTSGVALEEKIIEAPSVSSLINLEDNYYDINNSLNCIGSKSNSQKKIPNLDILPVSNSETYYLNNYIKDSNNKSNFLNIFIFIKYW